jgi:RNA polymerase primary sigma factor
LPGNIRPPDLFKNSIFSPKGFLSVAKDKDGHDSLHIVDRDSSSVDNGESINVYMKLLQKIPLLSKDEEIKLAKTIRSSKGEILELCCEVPEFLTELYLLKDLSITEQRKLFFTLLEEDSDRKEVIKLMEKLQALILESLKAKKKIKTANLALYLKNLNFTLNDLIKLSKPVTEHGTQEQSRKLKMLLDTFKKSKDKMITSNLRLVFSRAKIYLNKGLSLEDLLQEGNIGLIKAIEKYDVEKGYKFGTYATWWIDQALGRAVADKGRLIRIPVHMVENINRITKVNKTLTQKLGRNPKLEELSEAAALSEDKIKKVHKIAAFPQSVEEPQGEIGVPLSEFLVDYETPDPHTILERKELMEKVKYLLSKLDPREEKIIRMRFGIGEKKPQLLEAIGKQCNISGERVRQLVNKSLYLLAEYGSDEDLVERGMQEFWKRSRRHEG